MILSYLKRFIKFCLKIIIGTSLATGVVMASGMVMVFMFVAVMAAIGSQVADTEMSRDIIFGKAEAPHTFVSIPIDGMIVGSRSDIGDPFGLFSQAVTYGYDIKQKLRELAEDTSVSGVILEINSPGGTIYGAQAIADGVAYYKEKSGKPVISFVSGLAASGAYWSAIAADEVIADVGTSVGSIGVISGPFQYYDTPIALGGDAFSGGVVTEKGIETTFITAGKSKDYGNPYRRMTKEEVDSLQQMVNNEYELFVGFVSTKRNIPKEVITEDIKALLYDGKSAVDKKMIDKVGSKEMAYAQLAARANVPEGEYTVSQEYPKKGFLMSLLSAASFVKPARSEVSFCGLTNVRLAYHGDVSALCN